MKKPESKTKSSPEVDPEAFYARVAKNVKKLRLKKGLTQIELSYDMDVTKQVIQKIEAGKMNLTLKTLLKLSSHLETTPAELIDVI
ncbi:MAG: helix-turn-helix transcriptional regulator [Bacteroidota bacterium]